MIYVTGDTHGDRKVFLKPSNSLIDEDDPSFFKSGEVRIAPEFQKLTKDDVLIVAGDWGLLWKNNEEEKAFLRLLDEKNPYTLAFVDGNHENHSALAQYPVEIWHGGHVHRIGKRIVHLMRGQMFEIEGKRIFTMGGAASTDRQWRVENYTWWAEEVPSHDELMQARAVLEENGYRADYIITHTCVSSVARMMPGNYKPTKTDAELMLFFDELNEKCAYKTWLFGHLHCDKEMGRYRCLYGDVVALE